MKKTCAYCKAPVPFPSRFNARQKRAGSGAKTFYHYSCAGLRKTANRGVSSVNFMIKAKPENEGLNIHRLGREELEKKFVSEWREFNKDLFTGKLDYKHLTYLLSPRQPELEDPSDRDIQVAETVIQWLGSPVGQAFLKRVMGTQE